MPGCILDPAAGNACFHLAATPGGSQGTAAGWYYPMAITGGQTLETQGFQGRLNTCALSLVAEARLLGASLRVPQHLEGTT